jgi:hypothetical protein
MWFERHRTMATSLLPAVITVREAESVQERVGEHTSMTWGIARASTGC